MLKIKNGGLDQYGTEPFEQQQFGAAGVEGVNNMKSYSLFSWYSSLSTNLRNNSNQLRWTGLVTERRHDIGRQSYCCLLDVECNTRHIFI